MLTGTPLDATPFGPLLSLLGLAYWAVAIGIVVLTLLLVKPRWPRYILAAAIAGSFFVPVARSGLAHYQAAQELERRREAATALFKERCITAGERIHRTVDKVDGVVWLKWRSDRSDSEDQFALDDFYGRDCAGEECVANLLRVSEGANLNPAEATRHAAGFEYVETIYPDGQKYRYSAYLSSWTARQAEAHRSMTGQDPPITSHRFSLRRERIADFTARYGVLWADVSTRHDRENWITGGSLKVIDLETQEILAERVGYLADPGLGDTGGFRAPWAWASSYGPRCPEAVRRTRDFVLQALVPR